jgi:hypothetical protein
MTITYPRALHDVFLDKFEDFDFDHFPLGNLSQTASGEISFQEKVGGGVWTLSLATRPLRESEHGAAHAWYLSLRGGARSFKAYDLRRPWPMAYGPSVLSLTRSGGGTFDGTCTVTAAGGETVSLSGLPAGYRFSEGDYLSFAWLGRQVLVKALQALVANSGGAVTALSISPWLLAGGAVPVTATLVRAWCLMRPVPRSWNGGRQKPAAFQAVQSPS